jgi:hypothetical protein
LKESENASTPGYFSGAILRQGLPDEEGQEGERLELDELVLDAQDPAQPIHEEVSFSYARLRERSTTHLRSGPKGTSFSEDDSGE